MIIKVLFAILVLSAAALIGVAVAVAIRVWWHLKSQRTDGQRPGDADVAQERGVQ